MNVYRVKRKYRKEIKKWRLEREKGEERKEPRRSDLKSMRIFSALVAAE